MYFNSIYLIDLLLLCVHMCICVCVCTRACAYESGRETECVRECARERVFVCVCVCVCVEAGNSVVLCFNIIQLYFLFITANVCYIALYLLLM